MSITATISSDLGRKVDQLVREVAGGVVNILEEMGDELAGGARREWYDNVTRRTGKSGESNDYRMELRGSIVRAIVYNDATQQMRSRRAWETSATGVRFRPRQAESYAYYVRRPGPFSKLLKALNAAEYSATMSYYREHGTLPPGMIARSMTDANGRSRPMGVSRAVDNPAHYDGRNVWKLLVTDRSKQVVADRLSELDAAIQTAGKKFAR